MFDRWNDRVEELAEKPDPRSADSRNTYQVESGRVEKHRPDKQKMDDYWKLFKEVSIIRESIRAFAVEVFSDGYYVDAGSEEARKELEQWMSECGISNGVVDLDFADIGKEAVIQQEVRGTAIVERVMDENDNVYGFKSMPPDTVKQYTRPGQSVLMAPDEDVSEYKPDTYVRRSDGKIAAYVQWDSELGYDKPEKAFTRDEIIKLVRDGDVGDVWGNSRLAAIEERVHSLLNKLENNDKAIESLAWKFWLFQFGTEENPWPEEKIKEFMGNHSPEEFEPGEKHGVQGNVDIKTVNGEVADIEDYLGFDIDWIIAALPYVKYGLGGFEENVNQFVSRSQESRIQNQLQETRRRLAQKFEPTLKEKAKELGYDSSEIELVIGLSPEERILQKELAVGNIPYYPSGSGIGEGDDETDYGRPPASSEGPGGPEPTRPELQGGSGGGGGQPPTPSNLGVWDVEGSVAELADPRLTAVHDEQRSLKKLAEDTMLTARDEIISNYRDEWEQYINDEASRHTTVSDNDYRLPADRAVRKVMSQSGLVQDADEHFLDALHDTYSSFRDESFIDPPGESLEDRQYVREFTQNFYDAVRDAVERMARQITQTIRSSASRLEEYSTARERAMSRFDEGSVGRSANLIAGMETRNLVQTTKLREYRRSDEVVGVQVVNPCTEETTELCEHLAGCDGDEPAVAYFDDDRSIGEQLGEFISQDMLYDGFSPLPMSPPYHWHCRSELVAVTEDMRPS